MLIFAGIDHFIVTPSATRRLVRAKTEAAEKEIETYFENLSRDEIGKLQQYADGNYTTQYFWPSDGIVQGLVHKGILYCSASTPGGRGRLAYNVTPLAAPYLKKHTFQEILSRITKRESEVRQASIDGQSNSKP
jgi:hypothetical protein